MSVHDGDCEAAKNIDPVDAHAPILVSCCVTPSGTDAHRVAAYGLPIPFTFTMTCTDVNETDDRGE